MSSSPIPNSLSLFHCDPTPITEFDDSDLLEGSNRTVSSLPSNGLKVNNQHVPIIRQSVLIGSLLEQLCSLYEPDKVKSQKLYYVLCDQLSKSGVISPVAYLKEFSSVHTQYKETLYNIIQSSIVRLDTNPVFANEKRCLSTILDTGKQEATANPVVVDREKVFDFNTSTYHQDFVEKGKIGGGGYGSVFQALKNIDGQEYAIKKIVLKNSVGEYNETLLREVQILAGLRHKNIVRYYSAWIENEEEKIQEYIEEEPEDSFSNGDFVSAPKRVLPHNDSFLLRSSSNESFDGSFGIDVKKNGLNLDPGESSIKRGGSKFWGESSTSDASTGAGVLRQIPPRKIHFSISPQGSDNELGDDLVFQNSNPTPDSDAVKTQSRSPPKDIILTHGVRRDMDLHRVRSFILTKEDAPNEYKEALKAAKNRSFSDVEKVDTKNNAIALPTKLFPKRHLFTNKLVLYIQMELCQMSLKQWLSIRNKNIVHCKEMFHEGKSLMIMKQIVSALYFIHSKGLIHRDVKPPNIFINNFDKPHVLLGDFGLAKKDLKFGKLASSRTKPLRRINSHTTGVGTTTYAAPEQLSQEIYDAKVDMYSFGIVVYELWTPFGTAMERARQLKQLRDHVIPSEFTLKHPQLGKLVTSLLDHDPKMRPSAEEIFQGDFFEKSKDKIIEEQQERIKYLEKETREQKIQIKRLQRILNTKQLPA